MLRQRRGSTRGFSCVPLFSLLFAVGAWLLARNRVGFWPLGPALFDPGTWMIPGAMVAWLFRRDGGDNR
jgi:hypothetical protein